MNPLSDWFLREHDVTSSECLDMSDQMALAIRVFLKMCEDRRYIPVLGMILAEVVMEEST